MLKIYQGRENIDKEKFIYEHTEGETLVIVPNQYTLVAEEQALKYLNTSCLLNVEILSMNRLGLRMLQEQGTDNVRMLDRYERYMLLARIIRNREKQLDIFRTSAGKRNFVEMVHDFIADFRQQECTREELEEILADPETDELLRKKIRELSGILEEYESLVQGKYKDVEDYVDLYTDAIGKSRELAGKTVWVYGFDSMTAKFVRSLTEIAGVARNVYVMVNRTDFGLEDVLIRSIRRSAEEKGLTVSVETLTGDVLEKSETLKRIEQGLFTQSDKTKIASADFRPADLKVVECANLYNEAENAAIQVYNLLHRGYRMKDIVIICNDTEKMQPIVERTFREYGLPLFRDARRSIRDSQVVGFVMNLLEICSGGYRTPAVMALLKSGLTGLEREAIWNLENYARDFGIKGSMWTKPFKYGDFEYDPEEFAKLEESRVEITGRIDRLKVLAEESERMADFIEKFYRYLNEVWDLRNKIREIEDGQYNRDRFEEAQWTAQSYNEVVRILGCVGNIMGDENMDLKEFVDLYSVGILNAEVGLIPPTQDGLTMGVMIRTRPAPPKVVMVLSANEGILPQTPSPEGLFSVDEKQQFARHEFVLGSLDDLKMMEENGAMYRTVSQASEKLYVSYSLAGSDGSDMKPSVLVDYLKDLFPQLKIRKDAVSRGFNADLIQNGPESLRHMMNHFKERPMDQMIGALQEEASSEGEEAEAIPTPAPAATTESAEEEEKYLAEGILRWYEKHRPEQLKELSRAGLDENSAGDLDIDTAGRLYRRGEDFVFSASKLEKYNHCPFEFFVMHGLRAEEPREFRSSGREIGDVYHECIMRVSKRLLAEGILEDKSNMEEAEAAGTGIGEGAEEPKTSESQAKAEGGISMEHLAEMVDEELLKLSESYRGGLFVSGDREKYRMSRIRRICEDAVRVLAEQLRLGNVEMSFFEEQFGRGCRFRPIEYTLHGQKVYIEGKIDRADLMRGGNIRIIDYKTGKDKLDIEQMRMGYKMQLMVYLEGASGDEYNPVGMFYFNISDSELNANKLDEVKQQEQLAKEEGERFSLRGAVLDDPAVLSSMPVEMLEKKPKKMSQEEFRALREDVHKTIELLSDGIVRGKIDISPTRLKKDKRAECTYCQYRAICKFDLTYRNNKYRQI